MMLNRYHEKKYAWWVLGLTLFVGFLFAGLISGEKVLFQDVQAMDKPLRLHVLANSDSAYDQQVKLALRDYVIELLADDMAEMENKTAAMDMIQERQEELTLACNAFLAENGLPYTAELRLERTDFPEITYDNAVFAAGEYDALRIVLGEGKGHNWWCVLFPPLCFIDAAGEYETQDAVSVLAEYDDYAEEAMHPQIRWKLAELFSDEEL